MVKIIAVTGGKGGTGKSTCSIQLSLALVKLGYKVLLVDMDEGMRCLDMLLGVSEKVLFDLSDAISGKEIEACAIPVNTQYGGFSLLSAPINKGYISKTEFLEFLSNLATLGFDYVIFDLPAGVDAELYKRFPTDTDFLCVCNPNPVSVRDAANVGRLLGSLSRRGFLIINKFERFYIKNPVFSNLDDIINHSGLTLIGIIPENNALALAFLNGRFITKGRVAKAFIRIAKRLCGKNIPLPKLKKI